MKTILFIVVSIVLALYGPQTNAQPFAELVVFGDSHSDTGNWAEGTTWPMPPAYLVGRFSNGPVWVEGLAAQLNLPSPTPSEAGGLNYAWGGARTGYGYDSLLGVSFPKVGTQVDQYLASHVPDGDELVTLFVGHNDFGWGGGNDPSTPVHHIEDHITALATAGITHFLVPNLHPLGHLPAYRGTDRGAFLNTLTPQFNALLSTELGRLEADLKVRIFRYDFSSLVQATIAEPVSFGLENVTDRAFSNGVVVPNPDEYLYWDDNHFTAAFYKMMGQRAAMIVPSPASVTLSGLVLGILVLCRYRPFGH